MREGLRFPKYESGCIVVDAIYSSQFITAGERLGEICPLFRRCFSVSKPVKRALLQVSALGLYEANLNGKRVGDWLFTPGWTSYRHRLQYQTYDVTQDLLPDNTLLFLVGKGWCVGNVCGADSVKIWSDQTAVIAALTIAYQDGSQEVILTGPDWMAAGSNVLMSEIYHGEWYDERVVPSDWAPVELLDWNLSTLIPQEGPPVKAQEELPVKQQFITPKGEVILDFGQNITGYVQVEIARPAGEILELDHGEVLDRDGNFYRDNLKSAKQKITYVCDGERHVYHPHFTYQGFRYVRVNRYPGTVRQEAFRAIAVHSEMDRTGWFDCSDPLVNRLYQNVIWGQKGNFLEVPTDCPQRDERMGWTGDAQVFVKTAAYNYDVERFFQKWLRDLQADQNPDGAVPHVVPNGVGPIHAGAAGWADAAVICNWQLYLTYGDRDFLAEQFDCMRKWVEYMRAQGESEFVWTTGFQFGDWLALDQEGDAYSGYDGATDKGLIATAFYAYSTNLLIQAGHALGKDMGEYEWLYPNIVRAFQEKYIRDGRPICDTQTAYVLALHFDLVEDKAQFARSLADKIRSNGNKLNTGFLGTAYLLDVLSDNGYAELAYTLLLQEEFPSWLYAVKKGATTIWEHWDGIRPDGTMWDPAMNSFNHYAYGAVAGWMYGNMAGIRPCEEAPAYRRILLEPQTDRRISYVKASVLTRQGLVRSEWSNLEDGKVEYRFVIPEKADAIIRLPGETHRVSGGEYCYIITEKGE